MSHILKKLIYSIYNKEADDNSELYDGRGNFYTKGIELFNEKPLVGIGLKNFLHKTSSI